MAAEPAQSRWGSLPRPSFSSPKFQVPTRKSLGLTTHVDYGRYNPNHDGSTQARKSLTNLDYSPLRRVTWASLWMAMLVSMGGFIFGESTHTLLIYALWLRFFPGYDTGQISGMPNGP